MGDQQAGNRRREMEAMALWTPRRPEILERYSAGNWSQQRLADHYGVTLRGMQRAMERLGIPPKSKGRAGEQNGRFKDGTQSTLYRQMVEKSHCAECGRKDQLVIHHKDHNHTNNIPENLQVLCSPCHSSHHKTDYWTRQRAGQL